MGHQRTQGYDLGVYLFGRHGTNVGIAMPRSERAVGAVTVRDLPRDLRESKVELEVK